jgi:hypothetical protein
MSSFIGSSSSGGVGSTTVYAVADLASLAALSPADGALAFVNTVSDEFKYSSSSTLVADGITVINASNGGTWERLNIGSQKSLTQATWYISATAGNNENDGLTAETALASWAELIRRLGGVESKIFVKQTITINILTDLAEVLRGDFVIEDGAAGTPIQLIVLGTVQSTLFSGTITTVQAENTTTGVEHQITVSGVGDWSTGGTGGVTLIGERCRRVSDSAIFWPTARISATVAAIGPAGVSNPLAFATASAATLANGDAFVVEKLPTVLGININVIKGSTNVANNVFAHAIIDSIYINGNSEYSHTFTRLGSHSSSRNVLNRCKLNFRAVCHDGYIQCCLVAALNNGNPTLASFAGPVLGLLFVVSTNIGGYQFIGDIVVTFTTRNTITGSAGSGIIVTLGAFVSINATLGVYRSVGAVSVSSMARVTAIAIVHGSGLTGSAISTAAGAIYTYTSGNKPTAIPSSTGVNDTTIGGVTFPYAVIPLFDTDKSCGIIQV